MAKATVSKLETAGILTRKQILTELNITEETMVSWEESGFPHRKIGRATFYDIDAIKNWIAAGGAQ
jgi:hypothetical protein